jgi:hypothetical protein
MESTQPAEEWRATWEPLGDHLIDGFFAEDTELHALK